MEHDFEAVNKAIKFAADAHSGVTRKASDVPYIVHPMETATITAYLGGGYDVIAAAVLHDTVEDVDGITVDTIRAEFGDRIAELVAAVSENKREDSPAEDTWQIRKQETIDHLKETNDIDILRIAFADKLSNVRAMHTDFENMGMRFWNRFNQKDPFMHKWYYSSFLETCKVFEDSALYKEYAYHIDEMFKDLKTKEEIDAFRLKNKDELSFEEFKEYVRQYLYYAWQKTHKEADELVSDDDDFVLNEYEKGEDVWGVAADLGYVCG